MEEETVWFYGGEKETVTMIEREVCSYKEKLGDM